MNQLFNKTIGLRETESEWNYIPLLPESRGMRKGEGGEGGEDGTWR